MSIVTVVITTFNRDLYLKKCLESILNQSLKDIEILIISDGYFESTKKLVDSFNDGRVKLIFNEHTGLPAVSRNIGIKKANSNYIAFCDDDDIWENNKLEEQYKIIVKNNNALLYTNVYLINGNGDKLINKKSLLNIFYRTTKYNLFLTNYLTLSSIMLSTKLAKQNLFDENILLRGSEDYKFILKLINIIQLTFINKQLVGYRVHVNNISSNKINGYKRSIMILKEIVEEYGYFKRLLIKSGITLYKYRLKRISLK